MPEIRVQDEQGNVHVFPDGSTPEMIAKVMNVKPPGQAPPSEPSSVPTGADYLHALGLPASMDEYKAQAAEFENHPFKAAWERGIKPILTGGMGGQMVTSMAKEGYRAATGSASDPMTAVHAGSALNPFAAPVVDAMTEQGLGTAQANATGIVNAVPMAVGLGLSKMGGPANRMYQSALKPSLAKNAPSPAGLARTGIEAGIPVSEAGQAKLQGLIENLNDTIQGKIQSGSQAGATVDPADMANRLDALKSKFANQALPAEDLQTIEDAKQAFLKAHPAPMSLEDAQAMKQGTYQQLKGKYGQLSSARIEAEKALARGAKEELETQFPEIKGLNAQEGKLINLDSALERAVRRIGNHQLVGIGTPIVAGAVGGTAGGPAGIAAGVLKALVDDPMVKSKLAIGLNMAGRGGIPMGVAASRISSYSSSLAQPQSSDETPR